MNGGQREQMKYLTKSEERMYGTPPKLSKTQEKFLNDGLRALGMRNYREYLESPLWDGTVQRYRAARHLQQDCVVCCDPEVDLHHRTYKRLGKERLGDLFPLCRHHHNTLHRRGLDLWNGANELREQEVERWERERQSGTSK